MPEYLCPITGEPCPRAQGTGEFLAEGILDLISKAGEKVAIYGYFANLEMKIDRPTIAGIVELERILKVPDTHEAGFQAISSARRETVDEMMPLFLDCGEDKSGNGEGCAIGTNRDAQQAAIAESLSKTVQKIVEKMQGEGTGS